MQSPPFPRYLIPPRSKYSPQHHVLYNAKFYVLIEVLLKIRMVCVDHVDRKQLTEDSKHFIRDDTRRSHNATRNTECYSSRRYTSATLPPNKPSRGQSAFRHGAVGVSRQGKCVGRPSHARALCRPCSQPLHCDIHRPDRAVANCRGTLRKLASACNTFKWCYWARRLERLPVIRCGQARCLQTAAHIAGIYTRAL